MLTIRLLLCLLLLAVPALADESSAKAKSLYQDGMKHYNLGHHDRALEFFEQAYLVVPEPVFLFNIGQCYRLMGNPEKASYSYRRYLVMQPGAANRADVERLIADSEEEIKRRQTVRPPVETLAPPVRPVAEPAKLASPTTAPTVTATTATTSGSLTEAPPSKEPVAVGVAPDRRSWRWAVLSVGLVLLAGAGVGIGVGVGVGGGARDAPLHEGTFGSASVRF